MTIMEGLLAKSMITAGVALCLSPMCLGAVYKIFTADNENGLRFKNWAYGKSDPIEDIFQYLGYTNSNHSFTLKDEISQNGNILRKYVQFFNGFAVQGSIVTVTLNGNTYTGNISANILSEINADIGSSSEETDFDSLQKVGIESVKSTLKVDVDDTNETVNRKEYIRCVPETVKAANMRLHEPAKKASDGVYAKTVKRNSYIPDIPKKYSSKTNTDSTGYGPKRVDEKEKSGKDSNSPNISPITSGDIACTPYHEISISFVGKDDANPSLPTVKYREIKGTIEEVEITNAIEPSTMTGLGGNVKRGQYEFGSWQYAARPLDVTPMPNSNFCYLRNDHVDVASNLMATGYCSPFYHLTSFEQCNPNPSWDNEPEAYGQGHDALWHGTEVYNMLEKWFGDTALVDSCPVMYMCTHYAGNYDNAFYIPGSCKTFFGGGSRFYPLAVNDVIGHEIAHAYTHFTSGLVYNYCQSGSLNEAFSDLMGETLVAFVDNYKHDWLLGYDMMKGDISLYQGDRDSLRYFSDPTHDGRSIDCANDFFYMDPHYGSGVFNKAFYILSNKCNWSIRRAFALFLHANHYYWGSTDGYWMAAYRVWLSAYWNMVNGYYFNADDAQDVVDAFAEVGVFIRCPPGFMQIYYGSANPNCPMDQRRSCYKIVNDVASWAEAKVYCDVLGADLLTVETGTEQFWIELFLQWYNYGHHLSETPGDFWIGMIDMSVEGTWKTETGESVTFFDWLSPTNPDNYQGVQNCVAIRRNCFTNSCNEWGMYDDDCYQKKQFICESRTCKGGCNRHSNVDDSGKSLYEKKT